MSKSDEGLAVLSKKLGKLQEAIDEVSEQVESMLAKDGAGKAGTMSNKISLLKLLAEQEHPIKKEQLQKFAKTLGYGQGLAGFFKGKKASLNRIYVGSEERYAVSQYGRQLLIDAGVLSD